MPIRYDDTNRDNPPWWLTDLASQCRQLEEGKESEQDASDRLMQHADLYTHSPEEILLAREEHGERS